MPIAIKSDKIILSSEKKTEELAYQLLKKLKPGITVFLYGETGVGKTTFVKFLIIVMAYFLSINITFSNDKTMQKISNFLIDKTEVTIGEFKVYAKETLFISLAEKNGG